MATSEQPSGAPGVRDGGAAPRGRWIAPLTAARRPAASPELEPPAAGSSAEPARAEPVRCPWSVPVLLRREQVTVAVVLLVCLAISGGIWWSRGGNTQQPFDQRPSLQQAYRIDLNRCQWVELAQVTGIGETLARRIVELREQRGGFRSTQELLDVKGIGPKKFAEIQPYLLPLEPSSPATAAP